MTNYRLAPEVTAIAEDLVNRHHQDLLAFFPEMKFVFRDKAAMSKGHIKLGSARKVTGLNAWMANPQDEYDEDATGFFLIEIAEDMWRMLTNEQRVALVDHELCHCAVVWDEDGTCHLTIRGHDIEEFSCIVDRHGFWKEDVEHFAASVQQRLPV